jgi:hypothetical protein
MITFRHKKKLLLIAKLINSFRSSIYKSILADISRKIKLEKRKRKQRQGAAIGFTALFSCEKWQLAFLKNLKKGRI